LTETVAVDSTTCHTDTAFHVGLKLADTSYALSNFEPDPHRPPTREALRPPLHKLSTRSLTGSVEISIAGSPCESGLRYDRSVSDVDNILADFPAEAFTIFVHCEACGHRGIVDRAKVPEDMPMQTLHKRLRCSACSSHHVSIRIVYTGAGGFHYGPRPRAE
jgi:hypothetical protein